MKPYSYTFEFLEFLSEKDTDIYSLLRENGISYKFMKDAYLEKRIEVNGRVPELNGKLESGDIVRIFYKNEKITGKTLGVNPKIVFENENYMLVNKEGNIAVHPSFTHKEGTLYDILVSYFKKKGINRQVRFVNRLDLETSGLILVAKNPVFQQQISKQLEKLSVEKTYLAIVEGHLEGEGAIDGEIARDPNSIMIRIINREGGVPAITKYKSLKTDGQYSLVELSPITGRTHQLRVHMKSIGHSIIGDSLYNSDLTLINRCALHSYKISFFDPFENREVKYKAEVADDMKSLINKLF